MRYDRAPFRWRPMFSTLLGALPTDPARPIHAGDEGEAWLDDVAALDATGLELVSDGGEPADPTDASATVVARWVSASTASSGPVKAVLLGPFSAARSAARSPGGAPRMSEDELAEQLRPTIAALAAAGCALVEIAEPDAAAIATDPSAAATFASAHARLIDGSEGIHASLALPAGNLDGVPPAVLFDLAYASYAFDLIGGPDNWRLIVQAPTDRGIVCGAQGLLAGTDTNREVLVWAAHYAASTNGRGLARVGLANAPLAASDPPPSRSEVLRRLAIVAEASRIAAVESGEEMSRLLDPRAVDIRSAAMGRYAPASRRARPRR
jgi:hypothetical protein